MEKRSPIACFGAANIDVTLRGDSPLRAGTSNPVQSQIGFGGVARNVAVNLSHLSHQVALVSRVGSDLDGDALLDHLSAQYIDIHSVARSATPTGRYTAALNPDGDLFAGFAGMEIYEEMTVAWINDAAKRLANTSYWFIDTNLPMPCLNELVHFPERPYLIADAVSVAKASKLREIAKSIDLLICNSDEFDALGLRPSDLPAVIVTDGTNGCMLAHGTERLRVPAYRAEVKSVTGAGDAFTSGIIHALALGVPWAVLPSYGVAAAAMAVESLEATPVSLSQDNLQARVEDIFRS